MSIHHSPQKKKKKKKKKNDRYSTTEIFIFSPPLFFFFASSQGKKYILGRTEERDGRSWSERDGSVSKGRQIGKKREGGGGGGQVRGHVCKRDKTSSFHFD